MKTFLPIFLLFICGLSTSGQPTDKLNEEYKVYNAVLKSNKELLIIRDKTNMDEDSKNMKFLEMRGFGIFFKELNPETLTEFLTKNETTEKLEEKFSSDITYKFISTEELEKQFAFKSDGEMNWEDFRTQYQKNEKLFTLSRVGFSKEKDQALVFITFWCGFTCGEGNFYILKKENSEWKIVNKIMSWIS